MENFARGFNELIGWQEDKAFRRILKHPVLGAKQAAENHLENWLKDHMAPDTWRAYWQEYLKVEDDLAYDEALQRDEVYIQGMRDGFELAELVKGGGTFKYWLEAKRTYRES